MDRFRGKVSGAYGGYNMSKSATTATNIVWDGVSDPAHNSIAFAGGGSAWNSNAGTIANITSQCAYYTGSSTHITNIQFQVSNQAQNPTFSGYIKIYRSN